MTELTFSIRDASRPNQTHDVKVRVDAHGCVLTIEEKDIIVDCNENMIGVYLGNETNVATPIGKFTLR